MEKGVHKPLVVYDKNSQYYNGISVQLAMPWEIPKMLGLKPIPGDKL